MVFKGLLDYITTNYTGKIVEIGSGNFFKITIELQKRGFEVICTDVKRVKPPEGVKFVIDDIRKPNFNLYRGSALIYSIRPPYEIFEAIHSLSRKIQVDCIIKPLPDEIPKGFKLVNHKGDFFYLSKFYE